jgi:hypothetical protein
MPRYDSILFVTPEVCSRNTVTLTALACSDGQVSRIFWMCHNLASCVRCLNRTVTAMSKITVLALTARMRHSATQLLPGVDILLFTPLLPAVSGNDGLPHDGHELRVLVPGSVNSLKRNLISLVPVRGEDRCTCQLHFHVFGKCLSSAQCSDLESISAKLQTHSIILSHSSDFQTNRFASFASLYQAVQWADVIAPCIDEKAVLSEQFINGKLSSSVILALSYRKTLVIWANLSSAYGLSNQISYPSGSSLFGTLCDVCSTRTQMWSSHTELVKASGSIWNSNIAGMASRLR